MPMEAPLHFITLREEENMQAVLQEEELLLFWVVKDVLHYGLMVPRFSVGGMMDNIGVWLMGDYIQLLWRKKSQGGCKLGNV